MTRPALIDPQAPAAPAPTVGLVSRLKLTEPVRLYLYSLLTVAVAGMVLAGALTGEWSDYALAAGSAVLGVTGTEAARASVYSTRSMVQAVRRAAGR